jgi:hypothetical protein
MSPVKNVRPAPDASVVPEARTETPLFCDKVSRLTRVALLRLPLALERTALTTNAPPITAARLACVEGGLESSADKVALRQGRCGLGGMGFERTEPRT